MFQSNQSGKVTKEENKPVVLYFSLEFGFTKTVHVTIQFDKLIGEEFEFNILKDIVCKHQQKIVIFELTQCSINKTVLTNTSQYVLHGIAWVVK